jgi:HEPN domain-containing protein
MKLTQIKKWFSYGDKDLRTAYRDMEYEEELFYDICIHCQQAAEKYLKAFIMYKTRGGVKFTHDLVYLLQRANEVGDEQEQNEFTQYLPDFAFLQGFEKELEYPSEHGLEVDKETAELALKCAERIKRMTIFNRIRDIIDK